MPDAATLLVCFLVGLGLSFLITVLWYVAPSLRLTVRLFHLGLVVLAGGIRLRIARWQGRMAQRACERTLLRYNTMWNERMGKATALKEELDQPEPDVQRLSEQSEAFLRKLERQLAEFGRKP